ncbi:MAG: resolvase [Frankiales bacterium]|nr:resolvase [Frankiales bacterium]
MVPDKFIAYLRVSTDKQAEQGLGIDVQREAIRKWARANGHKITGEAVDEGVSGSNGLDTRTGLAEALAALKHGQAVGIAVYRLDRLARDLVLQEQLLAEIRRMGCDLASTSAAEAGYLSDDPDDPSRRLIRQVLGAVSEYERAMIRLRLAAGRRRKAELGGYAFGSPPFGYRAEGKALVPHPDEYPALLRIRELHESGKSLRGIAATLTAEGHRPKRSTRWHTESLRQILART